VNAKTIIITAFFVQLALIGSGKAGLDPQEPIELSEGGSSWLIYPIYGEQDRIFYHYSRAGQIIVQGIIETNQISDHHPSALLYHGTPVLVFTSFDGTDEDVYYVYWSNEAWSEPTRLHPDNAVADMAPEIRLEDGEMVVSWWQNTGRSIIEYSAFWPDNNFRDQHPVVFEVQPLATSLVVPQREKQSSREPDEPLMCIAHGDSITAGCKRDSAGNTNSLCDGRLSGETNFGYVDDLISLLDSEVPGSRVYNYGAPGYRSYQGVSILPEILEYRHQAQCVLIMYGANDHFQGLSASSTAANVETMARISVDYGMIPVVATITPYYDRADIIEPYNREITKVVERNGYNLADQYRKMMENGWPHSGDGLHVSDKGDALMAEEFARAMKENPTLFPPVEETRIIAPIINLLLKNS
jgi:lysophospholipase L1-like esterase